VGDAPSIDSLQVKWPSGQVDRLARVPTAQQITIKEGSGIIRAQPFASVPKYI